MLISVYRRLYLKKLLLISVGLFVILYIVIYHFPNIQKVKKKVRPTVLDRSRLQLEQNGDYWIYNNFMRSNGYVMKGNSTVTLTTHGTYRDFEQLKWLLVRWNAPISMAVYVDKNDYNNLLNSIYEINFCTIFSKSWSRFISLQLVFHDKHMPEELKRLSENPFPKFRCYRPEVQKSDYQPNSEYPVNLLRNVARLNAQTYYVLALDPGMLPTPTFVRNFLEFANLYRTGNPRKTVYCMPVFSYSCKDNELPKFKSDLKVQLSPYLNGSLTLAPHDDAQLKKFRSWLFTTIHDGSMDVYEVSKQPQLCPAYVSSNAFEPLYDQRYDDIASDPNSMQLQLLVSLDFDFVVLDGSFILRRQSHILKNASKVVLHSKLTDQKLKHLGELIKMNSLALGFASMEQ